MTSDPGAPGPAGRPDLLRSLRVAAGLSQPEVSRRAGLSQPRLSRAENGRSILSPDEVDELAALYGVRSFQPVMVLGVLQTGACAAAVFGTAEDDPLVAGRAARTERLLAEPGRRWVLLQTEGSLRWLVGSPRLMAAQVRHVREVAERANVEFGLIRWRTPAFGASAIAALDESAADYDGLPSGPVASPNR